MFFRFSDAEKRDTLEFASVIQRINDRPKPPQPQQSNPNVDNYHYGISVWKDHYLQDYDEVEKVVKQLAPGDPVAQDDWLSNRTHAEIAHAFIEIIMFKK